MNRRQLQRHHTVKDEDQILMTAKTCTMKSRKLGKRRDKRNKTKTTVRTTWRRPKRTISVLLNTIIEYYCRLGGSYYDNSKKTRKTTNNDDHRKDKRKSGSAKIDKVVALLPTTSLDNLQVPSVLITDVGKYWPHLQRQRKCHFSNFHFISSLQSLPLLL